ncbi:ribose-phosphate pyrophosphokinase [Clostridium tepidiprofundi DSM 19306]|uniref:ribose-phosphate diphosphokinase n=1 Tax=Clostridium tepidiprofundi DSM 19306 TaxID=1121338 RepID=A0A151B0U9_9CLOT|nr:ribose-phosphate pyrophosphokinase [Clostridium tepidiprofundi]KYH33267.1 ribose-phosphate pyrophosphokinase [Clostridium tepidiprofundi DSM 19306]
MSIDSINLTSYGQLGIIALESCKKMGNKIDNHLQKKRRIGVSNDSKTEDSNKKSYLIAIDEIRFSNGEGKVKLEESVRGKDIYILCDVGNYSCTYDMFGFKNHKGPDEHFQDIKRVVSAIGGKARRITVIMPLLYAGRQHRRRGRESLDCAIALQELERLGVGHIITFDVHDPNVQNAIPLISFDSLYPTYEIVKTFLKEENDLVIDKTKMIVISPDTGAMDRAVYYSSVLGVDVGLFYKRRDHSIIVHGKNPIIQHEYIGRNVEGKDILIVDDMIASGESIFDIVKELKKRNARKIFVATSFALFTEGIEKFNKFYEMGLIDRVYSTNLTYISQKVKDSKWYKEVDMSELIADLINNINYDKSIDPLLDATESIKQLLNKTILE